MVRVSFAQNNISRSRRNPYKETRSYKNMAWTERIDAHYGMAMTDGYVCRSKILRGPHAAQSRSLEESMARHLYSLTKRESWKEMGPNPDPLHIWIIGKDGWLEENSVQKGFFQGIHQGERGRDYRMVVMGFGWPKEDWSGNCGRWVQQAGMVRKKKHIDNKRFYTHGNVLLDLMFDNYGDEGKVPSFVLERFNVPYIFYGDTDVRKEKRLACRIRSLRQEIPVELWASSHN